MNEQLPPPYWSPSGNSGCWKWIVSDKNPNGAWCWFDDEKALAETKKIEKSAPWFKTFSVFRYVDRFKSWVLMEKPLTHK